MGLTWPLIFSMHDSIIGVLNVDLIDTVSLRFSDTSIGFWPISYPFSDLQPNKLDFFTFIPLRSLGFPFADNLWWIIILVLNGWSGHFMGYNLRGNIIDGFACGLFFLCSETILRESTLHHAPQIIVMGFPLFFGCIFRLQRQPSILNRIGATLALSGTFLAYWYYGLFLIIAAVPLLWTHHKRYIIEIISFGILLVVPFALSATSTPLADIPRPRIHNNPWFFSALPGDKSGRISLILCISFFIYYRKFQHRILIFWAGFVSVFAMSCTINSPLEEHLPYLTQIQEQLPIISRLHWPERWSILLHLGAALIIIQIPRYWLPFIFLETLLFSHNTPIPTTPTRSISCFAQLSQVEGNIVMWPWDKTLINLPAAYGRLHHKPILNPFVLPPGTPPPSGWPSKDWFTEEIPSKQSMVKMDIHAIFMDTSPWSSLSIGQQNTLRYRLSIIHGAPLSLGCADVWSIHPTNIVVQEYQADSVPSTMPYSFDNFWIR